jgi:hypothetical protein
VQKVSVVYVIMSSAFALTKTKIPSLHINGDYAGILEGDCRADQSVLHPLVTGKQQVKCLVSVEG